MKTWSVGWLVGALVLGLVLGTCAAWKVQGYRWGLDLAIRDKAFDAIRDKAREDGIAEGRRQQEAFEKIAEQGRKDDEKIETRSSAVVAAAAGLQHDAKVFAARASCDPGVARRGEAATRAAGLLSDMLGQCGTAYPEVAKIADQARARGLRCEVILDAIRNGR